MQAFEHRSGPFSTGESWLAEKLGLRGECGVELPSFEQNFDRGELLHASSSPSESAASRRESKARLRALGLFAARMRLESSFCGPQAREVSSVDERMFDYDHRRAALWAMPG